MTEQSYLIELLKTLADESRLALLQAAHEGEYTVGELSEQVGLSESTVSHHLSKLHSMQLLTLRMDGSKRFYRANPKGLLKFKELVSRIEEKPIREERAESENAWIDALEWEESDKQVLREHTFDGKLTRLPVRQLKKLNVILRWLVSLFEADRLYNEKEVNTILKDVYAEDFASLRRELVDFGYLRRERGGGQYWLAPVDESIATVQS
jgi:hypothetical protein